MKSLAAITGNNKYTGLLVKETSKGRTYYMKYRDYQGKVVKKAIKGIPNLTEKKALREFNRVKDEIAAMKNGIAPEQKKVENEFITLNEMANFYFSNHSAKTLSREHLKFNLHYENEEFANKPFMFVQTNDIDMFKQKLEKKHPVRLYPNGIKHVEDKSKTLSAKTIKNILNQASTVVKYCMQKEKYIGKNPFDFVIRPKVDNVKLKLMNEEEIELYLNALKKPQGRITYSDRLAYLFALLALTTGARVQTILHIRIDDIDFDHKIIHLYNFKTDTPYIGHIVSNDVEEALKEIIEFKGEIISENKKYLFYNYDRDKKYSNYPKAVRTVLESVINNKRRESEKLTVKEFRNVFATRLINKGMNVSHIQNLLNHKTPNMTSRYAQMLDKTGGEELKKMFEGVNL